MSIKSNAFSGVFLSGKDAQKFKDQVIYGKPKAAAVKGVKRGLALSRAFDKNGEIVFTVKRAKAKVAG